MREGVERITDLSSLRVLSNPDRMRVLALLRNQGEQTVGEICEAIGLAPGSASYHLRRLAEVGRAEKLDEKHADKRQSWWQATSAATLIDGGAKDDTSRDVQVGLRQATARSYAEAYSRYLSACAEIGEEWMRCEVGFDSVLRMTPEEARSMGDELSAVVDRWCKRCANRSEADGRKVLVTIQGYPWIP